MKNKYLRNFTRTCAVVLMVLLSTFAVKATTWPVYDVTSLTAACNNAANGDVIELASGTYTFSSNITVSGKEITIRAKAGALPVLLCSNNNFILGTTSSYGGITFEGLEMNGRGTATFFIQLGNSAINTKLIFRGCYLHNFQRGYINSTQKNYLDYLEIDNCVFYWQNTNTRAIASTNGSGYIKSLKITNSTLSKSYLGILQLPANASIQQKVLINNCTIDSVFSVAASYPIIGGGGIQTNSTLDINNSLLTNFSGFTTGKMWNATTSTAGLITSVSNTKYFGVSETLALDNNTSNYAFANKSNYGSADPGYTAKQRRRHNFTIKNSSLLTASTTGGPIGDPRWVTAFDSFYVAGAVRYDSIDAMFRQVRVTVPFGTSLTSLTPVFSISAGASASVSGTIQTSGLSSVDFTNPVTYTISNSTTSLSSDWLVTVAEQAGFKTFTLGSAVSYVIDSVAHTIVATVPYGTNVTNLAATYTTLSGLTLSVDYITQASGNAFDFTNPKTFVLSDGTKSQSWTVSVITQQAITSFSYASTTGVIDPASRTITINVPFGTSTSGIPTFVMSGTGSTMTANGTAITSAVNTVDFSLPVTCVVTNGTISATWTVTVNVKPAFLSYGFYSLVPLVNGVIDAASRTITLTVPYCYDVTALKETFVTSGGTVAVDGISQVSGTTTNNFAVSPTIVFTVTNNSSIENWNISVVRVAGTVADLGNLTTSAGTLVPTFLPSVTNYSVTFAKGTTAIPTITATKITAVAVSATTINANGTLSASTNTSVTASAVTSYPGTSTIIVTAEDGVTTKTYTIAYTVVPYDITVSSSTGGSAVASSSTASYGSSVSFTATPSTGYHFVNWTQGGAEVSASSTYTIESVTSDVSLVANFAINSYTISTAVSPASTGTIDGTPSAKVDHGTVVTLTATPITDYRFVKWSDGTTDLGVSTTLSYTATSDVTITAVFELNKVNLTTEAGVGGTVSASQAVTKGSEATVVATANTHYHFVNWTVGSDVVSTSATYTLTVNTDIALKANFELNSYTVSPKVLAGGSVSASQTVVYGNNFSVTATADAHYKFVNWTVGGIEVSTDASYSFAAVADVEIEANFTLVNQTVTPVAGIGGTVSLAQTSVYGSEVTITATPNVHYHFVNWTDGVTEVSQSATYTLTLNKDLTLTANFELDKLTLSADNNTGGSVSAAQTVYYGSSATVVATPNAHYHFVKWVYGASESTSATLTLEMTSDVVATAIFAIDTYTVTASVSPALTGTISGIPSLGVADYNSTVALVAKPATGYVFVNWTTTGNTEVSTSKTLELTVTGNIDLVAHFTKKQFTVSYASSNLSMGTVSSTDVVSGSKVDTLSVVKLTAAPTSGAYKFLYWRGAKDVSQLSDVTSVDVTVKSDTSLIAVFDDAAKKSISVSASPAEGGSVSASPSSVISGSDAYITAVPASSYDFVRWTEGGSAFSASAVALVSGVTSDRTFVAEFALKQFVVTPVAGTGGSVSASQTIAYGNVATLVATPSANYHFVSWTQGSTVVSTSASYTITVTGAYTATANFALDTYTVTPVAGIGGSVSSSQTVAYGSSVSLVATPSANYHFVSWTQGSTVVSTSASYTITVTGAYTATANFTLDTYTVTPVAGIGGSVSSSQTVAYGSSASLVATPSANYHFVSWTQGSTVVSSLASYTVTVTGAYTATANFAIDTYTVTPVAGAGGTVSASQTVAYGSSASLVATPSVNYKFVNWTQGSTVVSTTASYTITVTGAYTATANFALDAFTVTPIAGAGGTVSASQTVVYGNTTTLTATPNANYHFVSWTQGSTVVSTTASYTITVTGAYTATANFAIDTYVATPVAGVGGSVGASQTIAYGNAVTFVATPNAHYHFVSWTEGSTVVSTSATYTTTITGTYTATANFALDTYVVTVAAGANGTVNAASATVAYGTNYTAIAYPNTGYHLVSWTSSSVLGTTATLTINVVSDITLTANFAINQYTVTTIAGANGTVSASSQTVTYGQNGTSVTAKANSGYSFVNWTKTGTTTALSTSSTIDFVNVTSDISATANFTIKQYTVASSPTTIVGGSITGLGKVDSASNLILTAVPATGYNFVSWSIGNQTFTTASVTIKVTKDTTVTANFLIKSFTVGVTTTPSWGGSAAVSPTTVVNYGTVVTFIATAANGYSFTNWTSGANSTILSTRESYSITITRDTVLKATFGQGRIFTIQPGGSDSIYYYVANKVASGDFIELLDGDYNETKAIDLTKSFTIRASSAASGKPKIKLYAASFRYRAEALWTRFVGLEFEGWSNSTISAAALNSANDLFTLQGVASTVLYEKSLSFSDCYVHHFNKGLRLYSNNNTVFDSLLIDNVIWRDKNATAASNAAIVQLGGKSSVTNIVIRNSTFYNINAAFFDSPYNPSTVTGAVTPKMTYNIDHNTFFNVTTIEKSILTTTGVVNGALTVNLTNNIFVKLRDSINNQLFNLSPSAGTYNFKNNCFYRFVPRRYTFSYDSLVKYNIINASQNLLVNPMLVDTTVTDGTPRSFTYTNTAVLTNGSDGKPIGDPRWVSSSLTDIDLTLTSHRITTNGGTLQGTANLIPLSTSNRNLIWSVRAMSGDATVSSTGLVTATKNGTIVLQATAADNPTISDTAYIYITNQVVKVKSIEIEGVNYAQVGQAASMTVTISPSWASNQILSWSVSSSTIATINATTGVLTPLTEGEVVVSASATDASGKSATTTVVVKSSVVLTSSVELWSSSNTITEKSGSIQLYTKVLPLNVTDSSLLITVSPSSKGSISNDGVFVAAQNGTAVVTAYALDGSGISASTTITISEQNKAIAMSVAGTGHVHKITAPGASLQMVANVVPDSADHKDVIWTLTNLTGEASLTESGLLTALANGKVLVSAVLVSDPTITAKDTITISGQYVRVNTVSVYGKKLVNLNTTAAYVANTLPSDAYIKTVSWSVVNNYLGTSGTADINSSTGELLASVSGKVLVVATSTDGGNVVGSLVVEITGNTIVPVSTLSISTTASSISTYHGTLQFSSTTNSDASDKTIYWTVSPQGSATIDANGLLTVSKNGTIVVTATSYDNASVSASKSISVSKQTSVSSIVIAGTDDAEGIAVYQGTLTISASVVKNPSDDVVDTYTPTLTVADQAYATFDASTGILTAKGGVNGDVTVTASVTGYDGKVVTASKIFTISKQVLVTKITLTGYETTIEDKIPTSVHDRKESYKITKKGRTLIFPDSAIVLPTTAGEKGITWSLRNHLNSDGEAIATINAGLVRATSKGNGTIIVRASAMDASGVYAEKSVTITGNQEVKSVSVATQTGDTLIGIKKGSLQMIYTLNPTNADDNLIWILDSADMSKATISASTGLLTAKTNGRVKVYARSATWGESKDSSIYIMTFAPNHSDINEAIYGSMYVTIEGQNVAVETVESVNIDVYPNPAKDHVVIRANETATVEIFNMLGAKVVSTKVDPNGELNIADLKSGLYIVSVKAGNESKLVRLVKE